jgi:hypothetical protein
MSSHAHSREASAAERFVRATRQVDLAFRVVRGETLPHARPVAPSLAQRRLDEALDELEQAQRYFDSAVGRRASRQAN